jgi:hypothetical protein
LPVAPRAPAFGAELVLTKSASLTCDRDHSIGGYVGKCGCDRQVGEGGEGGWGGGGERVF